VNSGVLIRMVKSRDLDGFSNVSRDFDGAAVIGLTRLK
ncbi:MAG: hypothetical protein ACI8XC_002610, partial [Gammaproteobacteria bacterium]